jgi:FKBP-type peptidyl-prolyl cis-trans isomerase
MKKIVAVFFLFNLVMFACFKDNIITPKAQLAMDTTSIGEFLKKYNITATKLPAGLWYEIDSLALGVYPVLTDSVILSYSTKLIPTLVRVDSSASLTVLLSSAIAGIQLGLQNFPAGSSGRLYVPSGLAFGASSKTGSNANFEIPPNANLLYRIKLLSVKQYVGTQLYNDQAAITAYINSIADSLAVLSIGVIIDPSGLRYSVDSSQTVSPHATLKDSVSITYSAKILNANTFVTNDTTVNVMLQNQITGWRILIPKIPQGANATLYIASGYGYGGASTTKIPANSNLVYQLKLNKVTHHP